MSVAENQAVFLSYASQDVEAAQRLCATLRAAGVEVWFDQNELVGGDAWDQKIRGQVKSCALFVPVISAATQARREGYFRIEWKLAAQRTHAFADGTPFLLPVVIDATKDAEALVPEEFRAVQWTRLPGGEGAEKFGARVKALLGGSEMEPGRPRPGERGEAAPAPADTRAKLGRRVPAAAWGIAVLAAVFAAGGYFLTMRTPDPAPNAGAGRRPTIAEKTAAANAVSMSEAQKLVAQGRKIYDEGDELDRENLLLAEDLVKRALALDAAEPSAWLLAAQLSNWLVWHSSDNSQERRAEMLRQAARARALAPDSVAAQVAHANARVVVAYANFQSASNRQDLVDLERELLALAARAPRDHQVQRSLAQTYRFLKRPDDALRSLRLALELSAGDPTVSADTVNILLRRKNYAEAEAMVGSALARRPVGRLLVFDVMFKNQWRGDLAGSRAALATWPGWLLREDRGAFIAWQTWLWSRQPDRALEVVQRLPRDYLRDVFFTGPRAVLTARAHELAGRQEAASADWHTVVRRADQELAGSPDDAAALFWKAWALSRLGDPTGAEAASTLLVQRMTTQTIFFNTTNLATLWSMLGRTDLAAAQLRAGFGADDDAYAVTRAILELDPAYEALRKDPQFAALAAAALAPEPAVVSLKADGKSVAAPAPASEGAQLAARALALFTKTGFTRDDLGPADDFAKRATDKEPDNAAAWGVRAGVQSAWIFRNWDQSEKRRQDTQALANKALALDPNEPEALLALSHVLRAQGAFDQAAVHLRRAIAAHPNHVRLARSLGFTLTIARRDDEARAVLRELAQRVPNDPLVRYELAMSYTDYSTRSGAQTEVVNAALEQLDVALAIQPFASALLLKATLTAGWRGDLPGMRATLDRLDQMSLADRSEDRAVSLSMWAGLIEHRPERVVAAAALTARTYFEDSAMPLRPKAWSLALAHRIAGKENLAHREWQAAETVLRQRMKDDPANAVYQVELAITLAWLEQREEAARLMAAVEPVWREEPRFGRLRLLNLYYGAAGEPAKAAAYLRETMDQTVFMSRKVIPLDPWWDKVRSAPEFDAALKAPAVK